MRLVPVEAEERHGVSSWKLDSHHPLRQRDGFALTDHGTDLVGGLDQAHYCIWCHEQGKDSCSHGLPEKKAQPGEIPFKKSPFNVTLAGCPLEERISEFHKLRAEGWPLGALAMIVHRQPDGGGHGPSHLQRLHEVLHLPEAGSGRHPAVGDAPLEGRARAAVGLRDLFAAHALESAQPAPSAAASSPPASACWWWAWGRRASRCRTYLVNAGIPWWASTASRSSRSIPRVSGITIRGERVRVRADPRRRHRCIEPLDDRLMAGFGGVAEYGITVRWDKNFLKIVRLLLERRDRFALYGGVRFGGTLDDAGAFALGFDHIALATGAGKPTVLDLPNGLANGVRTASDFLMALQLTGAAKRDSIANMQVRLPVVVVGGGLTAIDTATESLAYYPVQVEKFLARYETLVAEQGREAVEAMWTFEEAPVAQEFLTHARALREERAAAARAGRPRAHRRAAARVGRRDRGLSPPPGRQPVVHAQPRGSREGAGGGHPLRRRLDAARHRRRRARAARRACRCRCSTPTARATWHEYGKATLPARTILIAAGTQPNTVLAREDAQHFHLDGKYFRVLDEDGAPVKVIRGLAKPAQPAVLTDVLPDGRATSFFGDLHPSFFGNVVKAMAQRQAGLADRRSRCSRKVAPASPLTDAQFYGQLDDRLRATVERVERLTPTIVEVVVRAPAAARALRARPVLSPAELRGAAPSVRAGTRLVMEGPGAHRRVGRSRAGARVARSCSRWAARPTCARSCSRASRWC